MLNWSGPGPGRHCLQAGRRALVLVHRLVAERAPHALERAGIGVEHGHAVVAVAVGDEQLVGLRQHPHVRRLVQVQRVGVALALGAAADLHHELAVLRELQELVVGHRLQARAGFCRCSCCRPPTRSPCGRCGCRARARAIRSRARAAPRLDEVARRVEHHDRPAPSSRPGRPAACAGGAAPTRCPARRWRCSTHRRASTWPAPSARRDPPRIPARRRLAPRERRR